MMNGFWLQLLWFIPSEGEARWQENQVLIQTGEIENELVETAPDDIDMIRKVVWPHWTCLSTCLMPCLSVCSSDQFN